METVGQYAPLIVIGLVVFLLLRARHRNAAQATAEAAAAAKAAGGNAGALSRGGNVVVNLHLGDAVRSLRFDAEGRLLDANSYAVSGTDATGHGAAALGSGDGSDARVVRPGVPSWVAVGGRLVKNEGGDQS